MKQLTQPTLTGIDSIDKYLVTRRNLLDFTNVRYADLPHNISLLVSLSVMPLWKLLASELDPETFQAVIEANYPEGYVVHLTDHAKKHGYKNLSDALNDPYSDTHQEIIGFTDYIIRATDLWSFEIVTLLTEQPRLFITNNKPMANNWINAILHKTKDVAILEYLEKNPWTNVRFSTSQRLSQLKTKRR